MSTATQAVTTNHHFSLAPDGGPNKGDYWEAAEVVTDSNGDVYYAGTVSQGADIKFGCGTSNNKQPIDPPMGSRDEAFLVKFDHAGNCVWQKEFKSDVTDPSKVRFNYSAKDLTLSPAGNPIIMLEIGRDEPNGKHYNRHPGVVEFSSSGWELWADIIEMDLTRDSTFVLEAIGTSDDRLFAAGRTSHSVNFTGGVTKNGPLLVLGWGAMDSSQDRPRKWIKEFGGRQVSSGRKVEDLAVGPEGRAVIVGNYRGPHYHLDGTQADDAHNSNMFIQAVDNDGNGVRQWASWGASNQQADYDTEVASAVDFSPDGSLFFGGWFKGELDPQNELSQGTNALPAWPKVADNQDYFLLKYGGIADLPNKGTAGLTSDEHISEMYNSNYNNIGAETLRDVEAGNNWVAFTGEACDPTNECSHEDAFLEVFSRGQFPFPGQKYSNLTRKFTNVGYPYLGRNVALDTGSERVLVNGMNGDTKYSLGGGSVDGSDYFLVSYDIIP